MKWSELRMQEFASPLRIKTLHENTRATKVMGDIFSDSAEFTGQYPGQSHVDF